MLELRGAEIHEGHGAEDTALLMGVTEWHGKLCGGRICRRRGTTS
jgi:hypothetical protein